MLACRRRQVPNSRRPALLAAMQHGTVHDSSGSGHLFRRSRMTVSLQVRAGAVRTAVGAEAS